MIRVVIENILLFLLPTLIYVAYMLVRRRHQPNAAQQIIDDAPGHLAAGDRRCRHDRRPGLFRHPHWRQTRRGLPAAGVPRRQDHPRAAKMNLREGDHPPRGSAVLAKAEWLNREATQAVLGELSGAGYVGRIVGGAVRNALLGSTSSRYRYCNRCPIRMTSPGCSSAAVTGSFQRV